MTRAGDASSLVLTPGLGGADGVSALSRMVSRALAGARGPVDVVALAEATPAGGDGTCGVRLTGAGGGKARFVTSAVRVLRARRPALVVCLHLHLAGVGRLLAVLGRARLAVFLLGIEAWRPLSRGQRWALAGADPLLAISEHTARRFREANPAWAGRAVAVCHPGVPPDEAAPWERREPHGADADAGGVSDGPFALIVGRMAAAERYKGHDLLLDVWPRVRATCPRAALVVAGDGDDRARLEGRAAALGSGVRFTGRVTARRLAELYRDCAFLAMPSRDEGFGLVFLEAMRAGKACVGGRGAAAEIIEDGVTGLVVDPADPDAVLGAVLRLFREPETRRAMGGAGAARLAARFTEGHFQRRFRALAGLPT